MRVLAGMSVNIKYTLALFSALDVSVIKKNLQLARFSLHFARNRMILEKNEYVENCSAHVNVHNSRTIS